MKVLIEPEAEAEIEAAAAWYQLEAQGFGNEFMRAVQTAVSTLGRQPMAFAIAYGRIRRIGLRRFPWSLFYEVTQTRSLLWPVCTSTATHRTGHTIER
jgi:hypothetical protein